MTAGAPPIPAALDATLVLLRHGESTWVAEGRFQGRADVPLSEIGRRQAELAAERLAAPHASPALPVPFGPPVEVVHSPVRRAAETAGAVAAAIEATGFAGASAPTTSRPDSGFAEIGQGEWEGLTAAEIGSRWPNTLATWRRRPTEGWAPGGEALADVQSRVAPALERLLGGLAERATPHDGSRNRDQVLGYGDRAASAELAAGHPWSILVAHDGVFKVCLLTLFGMPLEHFWTFSFALCAITVVEFRDGRATLRAHNLAEHLAPLLDERALAISEARQRTGAL